MIKEITYNNKILALIIKADYSKDGVEFFTPNDFSQQLAYMKHPAGKKIKAHTHNITLRNISYTKEVLVIKKGKLRVDLYDDNKFFVESHVLSAGDVILLAYGGHGFECLEEVEMIEIKQGPYLGEKDKEYF
jgi:mannose-6-phosphate isomerase-like protein (cupin superfamily)